jgi:hypothetical protein
MTRAAVVTRDQVGALQGRAHPHGNRLLTAIGMGAAEHRFALIKLFELFLEGA